MSQRQNHNRWNSWQPIKKCKLAKIIITINNNNKSYICNQKEAYPRCLWTVGLWVVFIIFFSFSVFSIFLTKNMYSFYNQKKPYKETMRWSCSLSQWFWFWVSVLGKYTFYTQTHFHHIGIYNSSKWETKMSICRGAHPPVPLPCQKKKRKKRGCASSLTKKKKKKEAVPLPCQNKWPPVGVQLNTLCCLHIMEY